MILAVMIAILVLQSIILWTLLRHGMYNKYRSLKIENLILEQHIEHESSIIACLEELLKARRWLQGVRFLLIVCCEERLEKGLTLEQEKPSSLQ